ncbi:LamG-like jellyroll fold domain-containing protein, partial [Candidatus Chordibacter forsetii]|uniref:LamG-like jellyroll fold domain-containing protein n=1 Tax=Candidatus Chordibacter forsetii TaxID=3381758 RepID=UPI00389ABEB1
SADKTAPDAVSRTPQYIGRSDASNNSKYFAGDLDEVRLYKVALSADEVSAVYSETNGTTWYTVTSNSGTDYSATGLPSGLSINPTTGEISGHTAVTGDHNVTVTANNLSGSDSKVVTITINPSAPLLKSAYTVTRESDLLGWFKFDETTGTTATNYGAEGSAATLMSGAVFSTLEKKFGASALNIPTGSTGAYAKVTSPIDLGNDSASDPFSLSTWFKKLYPATAYRTLTRGSNTNHQVIVSNNSNELGTHTNWVGSGYNLVPSASASTWQHLVATFDGSRTKFYIDGSYVGQLDASEGDNIYAIGNYQGGSQRFAEYLDDFRVYGVTLSAGDITNIYGRGNGDVFPVTAGSSYATATATLVETGGADTTMTVFYDTVDKGTSNTLLSPLGQPNLKLWMDADDTNSFQLSGSNVIKWYNKAGSDYAFDQKTGDPTRTVVNGKNVVNFDGNDQLWTDNSFIASNYSILSVSRLTGGQNARVIASKDKNWLMGFHGGYNNRFYYEGWVIQANEAADTNWHLHALTMNNSDQANTWTNAVQSTTNGTGAHNSNYSPGKLSLGAQTNLSQASKGEVAELLVFDRVISTSDRQKLERYLAVKWGLTLPSSVPGWQNGYTLPNAQSAGDIALSMNGLTASTNYVFRIAANNSKGTAWSDAYSVLTNSQAQAPAISADAATSVAGTTATTNGTILSYDGADQPGVRLYYGDDIDFQLGWREAHLTGDADSGITSDDSYTHAINIGSATNVTVNGVTFTGEGNGGSTNSGTNWNITTGFTGHLNDSWMAGQPSYNSTVLGNIGTVLDKGFRFGSTGGYQKIKLTGLTDGQVYTFTTYNQSWSGSRTMKVSCSDLPGATFSFNQDKYQDSAYDGLLVECTYVADGTEAEFTVEDVSASMHLYAFSNRVASSSTGVDVSGAGAVGTFSKSLTGLSAGSRYEYAFVATNNGGATQSNTNSFVTLGLPQVLTPGATDVTKTSVTLNADLNSTGGATYTTGEPFSGSSVSGLLMWMDGNDPDGDGTPNSSNYNLANGTGWQDKSGNGRHASNVDGSPAFETNGLNGKGVVYFNGTNNAYISSTSSLAAHTENFSIFLLSKDEGTSSHSGHIQSPYNNNGWSFGVRYGHIKNVAYFNGWLYPQSQDTDSQDTSNFHIYQATLSDTDVGNVWLDGVKVMTDGTGANDGTSRKPGQISFGGDNRGNHTRSKSRIAEFFILNRVVPETERLKIEGYLARKWGLMNTMFSAAHPYYTSDPYQPTVTQGGENAAITFYWGDNNGSTTPANWDTPVAISGTHGVGVISTPLTGLTKGTTYYYTAKAVTSAGTSWGPVQTFVPANTALNKYSISDLALWVDASDLNGDGTTDSVTNGTAVSAWTDKSLTSATVNQTTTDNQPTRQANSFGSKPSIRFDGTNDFLNISSLRANNGAYSVYASVRRA